LTGKTSWVTGWGALTNGGSGSRYLQEVSKPVISQTECVRLHGSNINAQYHVCSGTRGLGKDSCQGDSGGPLAIQAGNVWKIAGVVSFGGYCGDGGVYTRVSTYIDWIKSTINAN